MARPKPTTFDKQRVAADNRRAKFDYHLDETFEAGIELFTLSFQAFSSLLK